MQLRVLGSGGYWPQAQRASSGFALEGEGRRVILDLGRGCLQRLADAGFAPDSIDHVHLTHLHPDHCGDLVHLLFSLNVPGPEARRGFGLSGPTGLKDFLERLYGTWHWLRPKFPMEVQELADGEEFGVAGWRAEVRLTDHSTPNLGIRFDFGEYQFAYSGDSGPGRAIEGLASGVDLFLAECASPPGQALEGHLQPSDLGALAATAKVGELLLTHLPPGQDELAVAAAIRAHFAGPLTFMVDGLLIALGPRPANPRERKHS